MTFATRNEKVLAVVETRIFGVEGGFRRSTTSERTKEAVISRKGTRFSFSALGVAGDAAEFAT
jgi:hypothetical protein